VSRFFRRSLSIGTSDCDGILKSSLLIGCGAALDIELTHNMTNNVFIAR
jgi:hypothetical protein